MNFRWIYSLINLRATLLVARAPRYVRQGRAVDQCDRGVQAVEHGMFATPVNRILVRIRAGLRHFRRLRSAIDDRHLVEYTRYARLDIVLPVPVQLDHAQLVANRFGLHQQLAARRGLFLAVLRREDRVNRTLNARRRSRIAAANESLTPSLKRYGLLTVYRPASLPPV